MNTEIQAKEYLEKVLLGFVPRGVDILCDAQEIGLHFTIIPKVSHDYRTLIGYKGENCDLMRRVIKLWGKVNAPNLSFHLFVPNPSMIEETHL